MKTLQGLPQTVLILGGGSIDQQSTWEGSTKTLQGLPQTVLILGVNQQSTWEGSMKTLQGLPQTVLILGGSIDSQLGKDLCKDFARITSDSVDPGGIN